MQIISGQYGGQVIRSSRGCRTHPMSDRAKQAIFNTLGDIEGLEVLDAYAGSGALGIEALSRGATLATFIDADAKAATIIDANLKKLAIREAKITQAFLARWLSRQDELSADIIFADPPYDDVSLPDLRKLVAHAKPGALLVVSLPEEVSLTNEIKLEILKQKSFAAATIWFAKKR